MFSQLSDAIATGASANQECSTLEKPTHCLEKNNIRDSCRSVKQTIIRAQNRLYKLWIGGVILLLLVTITNVVVTVSKSAIHTQKQALYSRVYPSELINQSLHAMID
ncbi:MAG: hypothetical protein QNJ46_25210 [Leptolyngbyaceae cyanobacterium MO_188.B28]|nr:hypothetical protein [Leptolyngbyaceae cyanobacterium MO_188.B28]